MSTWDAFRKGVAPNSALAEATRVDQDIIYLNSLYQVNIRYRGDRPPFGEVIELSIKRRDKAPLSDWRDIQRIKTELVGAEAEMVQLFPAESRHVDTSNQYFFFAFPQYRFPFGFNDRFLSEDETMGNTQRPFAPEHRELHQDIGARDQEVHELVKAVRSLEASRRITQK